MQKNKRLSNRNREDTKRYFLPGCARILLFFTFGMLFCSINLAFGQERVLLISSYHPGFPTFFQQVEGLKTTFGDRPIEFDIEFMDSKRFFIEKHLNGFYQSLRFKLPRLKPYDTIIAADDNALSFVLKHQQELFNNIPVVFFGVNSVKRAIEQNNNPLVTGVIEAVSMEETLDLITVLHPEAKRIYALVDSTPSGQGDLETFYTYQAKYDNVVLSEISLQNLSFQEFSEHLKGIDDQSICLLLSAYRDKNNNPLRFHQSLNLIKSSVSRPVYHLWYHGLGDGILGGKLISHFEQGKEAGKIALDILDGKPPSEIPVVSQSPNRFMFDYVELSRFHIPISKLPADHTIINQPNTFYSRHKTVLWATFIIIITSSIVIIILSINIGLRKKAEKALQQAHDELEQKVKERTIELSSTNKELHLEINERKKTESALQESETRFHSLSDAAFEGIVFIEDGKIVDVNNTMISIINYTNSELLSMHATDLVVPESRDDFEKKTISGNEELYELEFLRKDGSRFPVEVQTKTFTHKGRSVRVAAIRDITERKQAEDEIHELRGLLPICAECKKIRDEQGYWRKLEFYIEGHSGAQFSHGLCDECSDNLYGQQEWYQQLKKQKQS